MLSTYRLKEMRERRDREAQQELEAKLAPVKAELAATLNKAARASRMYWSQDLKHLAGLLNAGMFEPDFGVQFPRTDQPQNSARGREQFEEFVTETLPRKGVFLSDSGSQRLLFYCLAQAFSENHADMSSPETWKLAHERLFSIQAYDEVNGEVGFDSQRVVEPVVAQPAPDPTIADLETINTQTREGERIAHGILSRAVFNGEAKAIYLEWLRSLKTSFSGYEMPEHVQREAILWFQNNSRSFLDRRAFDQCRLNLVRRGLMPDMCLTSDDRLAIAVENEDTQGYESRRRIKQELIASRNRS